MSKKGGVHLFSRLMSLLLIAALLLAPLQAAERVIYYHQDLQGSTVAATDAQGQLLFRETYAPYGERKLKQDGGINPIWYTGKPHHEDFGLTYLGARWYDPALGRFLVVDPVDFTESSPVSFNRYAYGNNNPSTYIDPDGRFPWLAVGLWAIGAGFFVADVFGPHETIPFGDPRHGTVQSVITLPGPLGHSAKIGKGVMKEVVDQNAKKSLGNNPFRAKSAEKIDTMFRQKGFESRGPDPLLGKGGYVNPKTGRSFHIDPGGKYRKGIEHPHVDVNRPKGASLPKRKYPLGDKLNDN